MDDIRTSEEWVDRCEDLANKARRWQYYSLFMMAVAFGGVVFGILGSGAVAYIAFALNLFIAMYWGNQYMFWGEEREHWLGRLDYWKYVRDRYS